MSLDRQHSNRLTRRRFLCAGAMASMGFGLAELLNRRALAGESHAANHDTPVILIWLIVTGEFGHTPRVTYQKGTGTGVMQPGRDHWPQAMSLLVAGGGLRTGQVIGSTNSFGEHPQDRPLSPNDLWATAYRHLGIDTEH